MAIGSPEDAIDRTPRRTWYLVQCKPRQDDRAEGNLGRQDYKIYRPKCNFPRLSRGERQWVVESLFPGYLFINPPGGSDWTSLRFTRGVSGIVGFGEFHPAVSHALINERQARVESIEASYHEIDRDARTTTGEEEAFAGLEEIFGATDRAVRGGLLIDFLAGERRLGLVKKNIEQRL
ncbi:transcriptional activator RfaH [Pseudomonas sp. NA-150]|uniref:transcriptional activator RfaH n=1 Tax=Pseudomonas sp. NA-150 TaxID=3367525 RepID=UPI0037C511FA